MNGRGRPRTLDILTPREYEVLDLLRRGLSNREIAARLGISLAGAKFHVSEIIGKLGVESREEAASWQREPSRRWGFMPLLADLRERAWAAIAGLSPKLGVAIALPVVLAGVGLGVLFIGTDGKVSSGLGPLAASNAPPTPTPEWVGCQLPKCIRVDYREFTSIDEVAEAATFLPVLPSYLPAGFYQSQVRYWDVAGAFMRALGNSGERGHGDSMTVYYKNDQGGWLIVSQGYPARGRGAVQGSIRPIPDNAHGTVSLRGARADWVKGLYDAPCEMTADGCGRVQEPVWISDGPLALSWDVGGATGWEVSPSGEYSDAGYLSYSVESNALSLDELIKIAESVSLQ